MSLKGSLGVLGGAFVNGAAIFALDSNLAAAAAVVVGTITLTLSVINWIDKRIDSKILPLK